MNKYETIPFMKSEQQVKEIKSRQIRRKNLLKNLYYKFFETKGEPIMVITSDFFRDEDFEEFLDHQILEELGYIELFYSDKGTLTKPKGSYYVSITPKGILAYEGW